MDSRERQRPIHPQGSIPRNGILTPVRPVVILADSCLAAYTCPSYWRQSCGRLHLRSAKLTTLGGLSCNLHHSKICFIGARECSYENILLICRSTDSFWWFKINVIEPRDRGADLKEISPGELKHVELSESDLLFKHMASSYAQHRVLAIPLIFRIHDHQESKHAILPHR